MSPKQVNEQSEKAKDKLHSFLARMELKYSVKMADQSAQPAQQTKGA